MSRSNILWYLLWIQHVLILIQHRAVMQRQHAGYVVHDSLVLGCCNHRNSKDNCFLKLFLWAHMSVIRECLSTVISACWTTVDWVYGLKVWNWSFWCTWTDLLFKIKKEKRKKKKELRLVMICWTFPKNPYMWEKTRPPQSQTANWFMYHTTTPPPLPPHSQISFPKWQVHSSYRACDADSF